MKAGSCHKITTAGLAALAISMLCSCSSTRSVASRNLNAVRVPPGVTALTAAHADSLANQLFVALTEEKQAKEFVVQAAQKKAYADSLLALLARANAKQVQVTAADSVAGMQATREGYQKVHQGTPHVQKYLSTQDQQARQQALLYLQEAETALTRALQLNPYNIQTRAGLAAVYRVLGDRFLDKTNYTRAIAIWETLALLEPGVYTHYYRLAENYFANQDWQRALDNYEKCEQKLVASAAVMDSRVQNPAQPVAAAVDSGVLFLAVYYQGWSAVRLYNEEKSYASFRRALTLTSLPQTREAVQNNIKWLDWDNGHILGAVMRDTAAARWGRGEFASASSVYKEMLPKLRTGSARYETGRNVALLDYQQLNRKEEACERMLNIVESIPRQASGTPLDSLNQVYLNTFGTMCLNMGNDMINLDRKLAYTYFMQSAVIPWSGRGKSYFAMATLADANPRQVVQDGEQAYHLRHQLQPEEVLRLHRLLVQNYRRLGEFNQAKMHFDELQRLQGVSSQTAPGL